MPEVEETDFNAIFSFLTANVVSVAMLLLSVAIAMLLWSAATTLGKTGHIVLPSSEKYIMIYKTTGASQ